MNTSFRTPFLGATVALALLAAAPSARSVGSDDGAARSVQVGGDTIVVQAHPSSGTRSASEAESAEPWTRERMLAAQPKVLALPLDADGGARGRSGAAPLGPPGFVDGRAPTRGPAVDGIGPSAVTPPLAATESREPSLDSLQDANGGTTSGADPSYPYLGWRWFPAALQFPTLAIGKLFFKQFGLDYVCSASTIGQHHVATAGHCLHTGNNSSTGWSTNVLFCPGYNAGPEPTLGCWPVTNLWVKNAWYSQQDKDRDFAGGVTSSAGTVLNANLGDITGWLGYAWDSSFPLVMQFGYSQAPPFNGKKLIVCATSVKSYVNFGAGADSPSVGCHQRPGSSGGPWILAFGPLGTNPNVVTGNWLNGVNSQIYCSAACNGSNYVDRWTSPGFSSEAGGAKEFYAFLLTQ